MSRHEDMTRALNGVDKIAADIGVTREAVLDAFDPTPGYFLVEGVRSHLAAKRRIDRTLSRSDEERKPS